MSGHSSRQLGLSSAKSVLRCRGLKLCETFVQNGKTRCSRARQNLADSSPTLHKYGAIGAKNSFFKLLDPLTGLSELGQKANILWTPCASNNLEKTSSGTCRPSRKATKSLQVTGPLANTLPVGCRVQGTAQAKQLSSRGFRQNRCQQLLCSAASPAAGVLQKIRRQVASASCSDVQHVTTGCISCMSRGHISSSPDV